MAANRKQIGSNLIGAEAYRGKCPLRCEQCYANFGQRGRAAAHGIINGKTPGAENSRAFARKHPEGWDGSMYRIWAPTEPEWYNNGSRLVRTTNGYIAPLILRVSTLSDSSFSPAQWCRDILELWGECCFFNTTARALITKPGNLREVFNKVVVTTNGGFQRVYEIPEPRPRENIANAKLYARLVQGSMTPKTRNQGMASFLEPLTLPDMGFERALEEKVKFYRLRSLPTIEPRIETDLPVVHTVMRFKAIHDACEWARRYGAELRYEGESAFQREVAKQFGFQGQHVKRAYNRILIRCLDERNVSQHRNEWTELKNTRSWWRVSSTKQLSHIPYVCDRTGNSCKACGLCATLDGTEPDNESPTMAAYGYHPKPYAEHYLDLPIEKNPTVRGAISGDFFEDVLSEACMRSNPGAESCGFREQDEAWIADALYELADYCVGPDWYNESWDQHEWADQLLSYCFWALARKAHAQGMGFEEAWGALGEFCEQATGGVDLFAPNGDLMLSWHDGPLTERFGPIAGTRR